MQALTYRTDYAHTPEGRAALAELIGAIFHVDISPLDRWGHDPSVRSFGYWQGDTLVANVSLYTHHLCLGGRTVRATGIQSVATRPAHRGRGLFSDLLPKALAAADSDLILLVTNHPGLYTPHGFRPVTEHSFHGPLPAPTGPAHHRHLSLDDPQDIAVLLSHFANRAPVSLTASASDHPALFLLKARESPGIALHHIPLLDAIVALDPSGP
ncbi:GNAT family N-acetyltransferase, partial [Vannielia litorea]|uniref:GNAT family N-acetyltransferase n=1 Tax=Vannielia litorea TaxID=1217970 RepID=UPI001BD0BC86